MWPGREPRRTDWRCLAPPPQDRGCALVPCARRRPKPRSVSSIILQPMTEDEREHLLSTVGHAHAGLSEAALKLRLSVPSKAPALKRAMKAERAAFELKRALQQLDVKDGAPIPRRERLLPEVRRGGKVVDIESLPRHNDRHDEP